MSDEIELFQNLLELAVENGASDIHIKTDKPAVLRIHGSLEPVDMDALRQEQILTFVEAACPGEFIDRWKVEHQIDFAYVLPGVARFRVNAFYQRGTPSIAFRYVNDQPPTFEKLNHNPEDFVKLCQYNDGITLVCGPTGSGKSSTLAAMLNWINHNEDAHIVTLEDPIEFTYTDVKSMFNQREIGIDTRDFAQAMRAVLRQDPDIILIGEMRDAETFDVALSAAETGHYVFGTLHSSSAQQSVQRLFEFYPPEQHMGLRRQIASALRSTVTQRLVPALDGGRMPITEVFIVEGLARTIIGEGELHKINAVIEASHELGSHTFNQDLFRLVKAGKITKQTALAYSPNPKALEMNLKGIFLSTGGLVS
ncbi:MAG: PilT/PilU family type 4a pilus ATPase [Verrucomicrobiota bacterium JB022]|nr:PilT/PilU family type 4a pilus ATPase [Verrucomicrobiota bacterium JB022]